MANYTRRDFAGAAVATTLASSITNADTTIPLAASTGWPTGANGDFFIVIDRGLTSEEKIRIASRTSNSLTVQTSGRGADGTSAVAHSSPATVEHCLTKTDLDEANLTVAKTIGLATAAGQIPVVDAANSFAMVQGKTAGQVLLGNGTTVASVALSGDVTVNSSGVTAIGSGKVTSAMIVDATIATGDIADSAITSAKIADGTIATGDLADTAVSYAKIQNVATARLLGRQTAGSGVVEELTVGGGVEFATGAIQRSALSGDISASAGSGTTAIGASKVLTTMIADANVTAAKIAAEAWASYTPTLTQSGTLTKTLQYAKYMQVGKTVWVQVVLTVTGTGTSTNEIRAGLPVNRAYTTAEMILGTFKYTTAGGTNVYRGNVQGVAGAQTVNFFDGSLGGKLGITEGTLTAFGAANTDVLTFTLMYEAA